MPKDLFAFFFKVHKKNAKNSNNKIKVIRASATTTKKTIKNNKANIQPNKIQIKIPACLFIFFAQLQNVPYITIYYKSRKVKGIANYINHER